MTVSFLIHSTSGICAGYAESIDSSALAKIDMNRYGRMEGFGKLPKPTGWQPVLPNLSLESADCAEPN